MVPISSGLSSVYALVEMFCTEMMMSCIAGLLFSFQKTSIMGCAAPSFINSGSSNLLSDVGFLS